MNNQGWSLNSLLAGLGVLTFALVFSIVLYDAKLRKVGEQLTSGSTKESKNNYSYSDIEKDLVSACEAYLKEEYGKHIPEGSMRISIDTLVEENFYDIVYDPIHPKQKCTGYVTIEVQDNYSSYHPYLKCGNHYESGTR